jgi:tRNA nucleotidyltransferase (CCA-adding enzyme)
VSGARPDAPPAVRWIVSTLEEAGHETWAVGGAVRDVFLGIPTGDWDLTTHARPNEIRRAFRRTVPIGIEHGTVGVLARDGTMYEVTTFRRDVETDGRHAVVAFAERVEDDLARRDFTVNAIAWHPLREELLDPYGGVGDLEAGVLQTVGDPHERFAEDHLRILRAFRFASRFGLEIDPRTWHAAVAGTPALSALSAERVREELLKVLDADGRPSVALDFYGASGALDTLYPELGGIRSSSEGREAWTDTLAAVDALPKGRPLLRLAALLRPLDEAAAAALLLRLRLSNAQTDELARRAAASSLPDASAPAEEVRRWLSGVGSERISAVARLEMARARVGSGRSPEAVVAAWRRAREVARSGPPLTIGDLAIDGGDLIRMGLSPGPAFGEILDRLLDTVLAEPERNTVEALEERVRAWVEEEEADG